MNYELRQDPYSDPETGVLLNKLDIHNPEQLEKTEAYLTSIKIASLAEQPIEGNFDFDHLRSTHKYIFGEIYDWAGNIRTVELDRDTTKFANVEYLPSAAQEIFDDLKEEKYLDDLSDEDYITRFAHHYSEVNILHPFREGNGRTQRAFFSMLANRTGRYIAWGEMMEDENVEASARAYNGDEVYLAKMLAPLIRRTDPEN